MGENRTIDCKVERLTHGPKHHLFGFHDLLISNKADTKYLCLEVDTINRPPLPGEEFGVGYVENGQFVKVGETTALNYPQGARQQWVGDTNLFTVNNRVGDVWGTNLYDADTNKLFDCFPATTHMLSKDGRYAYGLDYARLYRLGVYGYNGIDDKGKNDYAPTDSGITVMDLQTKEVKLLVSVRQAAECDAKNVITSTHHYLTHLCVNPSSTRLAFLHRYNFPGGGMMDRLMTVDANGDNLRCLAQGYLSHYDWKDDNHIYIYGRAGSMIEGIQNSRLLSNPIMSSPLMATPLKLARKMVKIVLGANRGNNFGKSFLMISDEIKPTIAPFAQDIIPLDGHPMTNPANNDWCINDTYPDENGYRDLMLYNFPKDIRVNLGRFRKIDDKPDMSQLEKYFEGMDKNVIEMVSPEELSFTRSGLHCDLHPRWNSKGDKAFFDSIHEGTRQLYYVNVDKIINAWQR